MIALAINTKTAATFDGLTLSRIKQQCRVMHSDDDARLVRNGAEAVRWVENVSGWYFATRTLTVNLPGKPCGDSLQIPICPITAVNTIYYYDSSHADTLWASSKYDVLINSEQPSIITPAYGETWPDVATDRPDAFRVEVVAGHASPAAVPSTLQSAALMKAEQLYKLETDVPNNPSTASDAAILQMIRSAGWGFYATGAL